MRVSRDVYLDFLTYPAPLSSRIVELYKDWPNGYGVRNPLNNPALFVQCHHTVRAYVYEDFVIKVQVKSKRMTIYVIDGAVTLDSLLTTC